jgi:hypothetical protein
MNKTLYPPSVKLSSSFTYSNIPNAIRIVSLYDANLKRKFQNVVIVELQYQASSSRTHILSCALPQPLMVL